MIWSTQRGCFNSKFQQLGRVCHTIHCSCGTGFLLALSGHHVVPHQRPSTTTVGTLPQPSIQTEIWHVITNGGQNWSWAFVQQKPLFVGDLSVSAFCVPNWTWRFTSPSKLFSGTTADCHKIWTIFSNQFCCYRSYKCVNTQCTAVYLKIGWIVYLIFLPGNYLWLSSYYSSTQCKFYCL